ncbi:hypothetical protein DF147_09685 [Burkholderia cenocepacia]|nr:hypothetical protein DF147_09685 [Burkholderia cenocepacia]
MTLFLCPFASLFQQELLRLNSLESLLGERLCKLFGLRVGLLFFLRCGLANARNFGLVFGLLCFGLYAAFLARTLCRELPGAQLNLLDDEGKSFRRDIFGVRTSRTDERSLPIAVFHQSCDLIGGILAFQLQNKVIGASFYVIARSNCRRAVGEQSSARHRAIASTAVAQPQIAGKLLVGHCNRRPSLGGAVAVLDPFTQPSAPCVIGDSYKERVTRHEDSLTIANLRLQCFRIANTQHRHDGALVVDSSIIVAPPGHLAIHLGLDAAYSVARAACQIELGVSHRRDASLLGRSAYLIAQGAQDMGCNDCPRAGCLTLAGPRNCESRGDNRFRFHYGVVKDNRRSLRGLN